VSIMKAKVMDIKKIDTDKISKTAKFLYKQKSEAQIYEHLLKMEIELNDRDKVIYELSHENNCDGCSLLGYDR